MTEPDQEQGPDRTGRGAAMVLRAGARILAVAGWLIVVAGAALLLVPLAFGLDRYVITGNSMVPSFERGSVVFEREVRVEDLRIGDVITYRPPPASGVDQNVTHRISSIERDDDGQPVFGTKGDANEAVDPWRFQLRSATQNVVVAHVPLVGHVITLLSDPSKRVLIVGGPAALIGLRALLDLVGAVRDRVVPPGAAPTEESYA